MKKSYLLNAVCACVLSASAITANATLVTNLYGINIDGILYDVTFHIGVSFDELWDANDDGIFGGGASTFSGMPTFWGDQSGAVLAADAIISALGTADSTYLSSRDGFLVPFDTQDATPFSAGANGIRGYSDGSTNLVSDFSSIAAVSDTLPDNSFPLVSFTVSSVPVPAAAWLFGSGLIGLLGFAKRKRA